MQLKTLRRNLIEVCRPTIQYNESVFTVDQLLKHVLNINSIQLHQNLEKEVEAEAGDTCFNLCKRLAAGEPLQYVLGNTEFCGLIFHVNNNVLIPRPETEELVMHVLKHYKLLNEATHVLDIGTGSGCIAITLKKNNPRFVVTAIDISEAAINVAKKNAETHQVSISFLQSDIGDLKLQMPHYDVIVSNPPYVMLNEQTEMLPNVLLHEPHVALFAPENDALYFYRHIINFAITNLNCDGTLWLEINPKCVTSLLALLQPYFNTTSIMDMYGKERILFCVKK